jgi:hypothetical protein
MLSIFLDRDHFKPVLYGQARIRVIPPSRWLAFGSVGYGGIPVVIPADLNEDDTFRRLAEIIADTSPTWVMSPFCSRKKFRARPP